MFQLLKSERWNFAVFEVVLCLAVGELHAELVDMWAAVGRSPGLCLWVWVVHPIRRQCTRSDRVQRPVTGAVPGVGVAARTMAGHRAWIVSNEPPDAGRVLACYRWGVTPDREESTPSDRVESTR